MSELIEAVRAVAAPEELLHCELPTRFRAAYIRKSDIGMFDSAPDKDVRRSIHVGDVEMPDLAPDEVVVAVMAAAVNHNTVWSATYEPVPTFSFLEKLGRIDRWRARHNKEFHVIGSDAAGIVVRTGDLVRGWKVGDRVLVHAAVSDEEDPVTQEDGVRAKHFLAWGFETNYGAFAHFTIVKAAQLIRKPGYLTWEEAAANTLCAATAYRMLVGTHGAQMRQGDIVLVWGATGGLGSYAMQLVRNGGGIPVAVVSSQRKAELLRQQGFELIINRSELELGTTGMRHPKARRILGDQIRRIAGEDPHIVFEYLGAETFDASVYVTRRGGTIVTCGSSTGYQHEYDNRYLWMNIKRIVGSHGFTYHEATETNRLIRLGMINPTLSAVYHLDETATATRSVQENHHVGKVGVLCIATEEGLGVTDRATRERIGEEKIMLYRRIEGP